MESKFLGHCSDNNLEGVNECLSRGVDVNTTTRIWSGRQWTGLMFACDRGNPPIVSRLVQVPGLDINHQNSYGSTAAHEASMSGHTECVRILAETDRVDWNKRNNNGGTPLYSALWRGHSDIVDIIVRQPNIDYNVKTKAGETLAQSAVRKIPVAQSAVRKNYAQIVETLAAQESFDCWNVPDRYGDTPIMKALKNGRTELVEILLRCPRVDLSCRDREGWSLVFRAIQNNSLGEKISHFSAQNI